MKETIFDYKNCQFLAKINPDFYDFFYNKSMLKNAGKI